MNKNYKLIIGVFDAVTAKLSSHYADYLWISSLVMSSMLGLQDNGIVNLKNYLPLIKGISNKSKVPVILDFDIGGRNFREFNDNLKIINKLSLGGVCIEDESWPKVNAMLNSERKLISIDAMSKKISAAKKSLGNKTLIIARSHSLIINEDIENTQSRVHGYERAGADIICLHYTGKDWREFSKKMKKLKFNKSLMLILSKLNNLPPAKMISELPIKLILFPNQIYRAAVRAVADILDSRLNGDVENIKFKSQELLNINDFFNIINTDAK